jgi:peptide/nickel transport system substrate-binding protein
MAQMRKLIPFVIAVIVAAFGMNALAQCPQVKAQADLNPLVIKNDEMPNAEEAKNVACGGTVAATIIARPRTLNPVTLTDVPSLNMTDRMFEFLLHGSVAQPTPGMAEAFEVKKVGDKGQSVTFTTRKGLKFANGDPFTAEDVRFTFENLVYPKDIPNSYRDVIRCGDGNLPKITVDAPNKITFECAVTTRTFVAFIGGGEILNKKKTLELVPNVVASPKDFATALGLTTPPDRLRGIGAGPFVLTRIDPASVAEFARNPNYWEADEKGNQLPYINGYRILIAPTQGQELALQQFRNGQTDWLAPRPEDIAVLQSDKANRRFQVNDDIDSGNPAAGTTFWVMAWTTKNPALKAVFNSKEFRQAMSHATDRSTMKKNIFLGLGTEIFSHLNPNSDFYIERKDQAPAVLQQWEQKGKFPFNLTKAAQILDQLGLRPGADGIRTIPANFQGRGNPAGRLEFTLNTNVGNTLREEMIKTISSDLRKIGVNAKPEPKDFAALVDQLLVGDYEAILIGLTGGITPEGGANVYTCNGNLHFYNVDCPKAPSDFEKKVDELYAKGAATLDLAEAKKIWDEVQILIGEFQPLVHLVQANGLFAYRADVLKNHGRAPFGNHDVLFCEKGKCVGG